MAQAGLGSPRVLQAPRSMHHLRAGGCQGLVLLSDTS